MPYSYLKRKCRCTQLLLCTLSLFISINITAQVKWNGNAGDGQWVTAANWVGNNTPAATDDVVLDNSVVAGNYTVSLPGSTAAVTVKSIVISPGAGNNIQLTLPASNTAAPAFTATGPGYGITINNGGLLLNSSGSSSSAAILVNDSIKINSGGQYTHNTRTSHAALVTVLSKAPGTEKGIFKFDVPGGGYTFASTKRTYGTLILSGDASGGIQVYSTSAASPFIINGDFIINTGVTANLDITAATTIMGNYNQQGGVFNLASQPNNNIVYLKGDLIQTAGTIIETSTGLPAIELNGNTNQNVQVNGAITNNVGFRINNNAGVTLLNSLSLPYKLSLIKGIVNTHSTTLVLLTGCIIEADSTSNISFINGALRKEGLSAANFLFPVGKNNIQRWAELKNATGNFTVEFFNSNPNVYGTATTAGIHHISSIEYWLITADITPVPAASIELSFNNPNSGGVTDLASLRVAQYVSNAWTDEGHISVTGTAGSAGSVISNSLNSFGPQNGYFTLGSSDALQNPLPLTLISFSGQAYNNSIIINWRVSYSWHPAYFELQSSEDGIHFSKLSRIDTIYKQISYQCTDKKELHGKQYYRLKNIEADGTFFYSGIIQVGMDQNAFITMQVRPSIVKSNPQLFINAMTSMQVQLTIYSASGKTISMKNEFVQAGNNAIQLQLQYLPAGIYTLTLTAAGNKITTCRFVKTE